MKIGGIYIDKSWTEEEIKNNKVTEFGLHLGREQVAWFSDGEEIWDLHQDVETLCTIHQWKLDCRLDYFREGAAILHIISELPNVFAGVDTTKITQANLAYSKVSEELKEALTVKGNLSLTRVSSMMKVIDINGSG